MHLTVATAMLSSGAIAQEAAKTHSIQPTDQPSAQQLFESGAAAMSAQDWAGALAIYANLESRLSLSTKPNTKSLLLVRLRKGATLSHLDRLDEAEALISASLAKLPADDPGLYGEIWNGQLGMGDIASRRFDYAAAVSRFRQTLNGTTSPGEKLILYDRLIRVGIFVDPQQALADSDAELALLATDPLVGKEWLGLAHQLRGRTLLNLGRIPEARTELGMAIKLLGGMSSTNVNALDLAARSEAAIAAMRAKLPDQARRFLAYTGASMQAGQGFELGKDMNPPPCGGTNGPRPEDVAVVEFSIRANGSVRNAIPIYFTGKPAVAVEFARAVSQWSWSAEELKRVIPFFREQTRIEMRCSTVFNRPDTLGMLSPETEGWLATKLARPIEANPASDANALAGLRAELAGREKRDGADSVQLIPVLISLGSNSVASAEEAERSLARALQIAQGQSAPAGVLAYFKLASATVMPWKSYYREPSVYQERIRAALAEPAIAASSTARNALTIALFDALSPGDRKKFGRAIIAPLADDLLLLPNDPFKVGALMRLANLEYAAGKIEDARSLFAKTGLSEQQCALVDAKPSLTGGRIGDEDYPVEALQWGFGGWTVVEFDIDANGKPLNERPLISFPPFVFGDPTVKQIKGFRYEQRFRPDGGLGCGGQRQRVTYRSGR
jgi:tetratricopeptide (TPR) repeat protein